MSIGLNSKRGRKHEELAEEQIKWLIIFLDRTDITYINSGKKHHMNVGKVGESSDLPMDKLALLISLIRNCTISSNLKNSTFGINTFQSLHACVKYARTPVSLQRT